MTISEAKLEANRRNARRSTGPKTIDGKDRSRRNAVKHGLRAESLLMLDEDPQELEDRKAAWRACLAPRDEVELSVVEDAVEYAWMQDRARRALAARLATNIANAGIDQANREADEVLLLGQKLFVDRRGPLADYPHGGLEPHVTIRRVSYSDLLDDPEDPPRLVLHLQATAGGCEWMLDQWAELRLILEDGVNWQSVDKLKAVRLLGRQPMEAVDDRNVLLIFIACQRMEGQPIDAIPEIWNELGIDEKTRYAERLRGRGVDRLAPGDAVAAREVLFDIIDRATAPIRVKAEAHRRRAETVDALTADRLLFDDSPEGEQLRRYELANGRAKARALNELRIRQRSPLSAVSGQLPVVRGQLSVVSGSAEVMTGAILPNEPTEERLKNEDGGMRKSDLVREDAPNAPTGGELKNEDGGMRKSDLVREDAPNEPTVGCENTPNEPTQQWENAPNEPTDVVVGEAGAVSQWTAGGSNGHVGEVGLRTSTDAGGALETVATKEPLESFEEALKRIRLRREAHTRQLNEKAQREAADPRAAGSARRSERIATNHKPRDQPEGRAGRTGPRPKKDLAAPQTTNLNDLTKASLALVALIESSQAVPD